VPLLTELGQLELVSALLTELGQLELVSALLTELGQLELISVPADGAGPAGAGIGAGTAVDVDAGAPPASALILSRSSECPWGSSTNYVTLKFGFLDPPPYPM
jgi:hypothetical protein